MERRTFLASAAMASMVTPAIESPLKPPVLMSPFFRIDGPKTLVLDELSQNGCSILQRRFDDNQGFVMHSVEDIEDYLIASGRDLKESSFDRDGAAPHHYERLAEVRRNMLTVAIVSECNEVAIRSRRGPANHVLMHPTLVERLDDPFKHEEPYPIGRWTDIGSLLEARVLVSDAALRDEVIVFWKNRGNVLVDGPAAVMQVDGTYCVIPISKYPVMSRFKV